MLNRRHSYLALGSLVLAGCGGPPPAALHPVSGTVTLDGKPAVGGGLIFVPESENWGGMVVNGSVTTDGTFTATTSRTLGGKTVMTQGAPAGRFKVVYYPPSDGQAVGTETELSEVVVIEPKENLLRLDVPPNCSTRELRKQAAESKGERPPPTTGKK